MLMEEIRLTSRYSRWCIHVLSHYVQGFIHPNGGCDGFLNHQLYYGPSKNPKFPFLALNTPHGAWKFQACANISYANFPLDTHVWHLEWDWNGSCRAVKLHADGCQDSMMELMQLYQKNKLRHRFGKLKGQVQGMLLSPDHTTKKMFV